MYVSREYFCFTPDRVIEPISKPCPVTGMLYLSESVRKPARSPFMTLRVLAGNIFLFLLDDFAAVLVDAVFRNDSPDAGCRIDIAVPADDCSRVAYRIAAYFYMITEHSAELLDPGLDIFSSVVDYDQLLVGLDVRSDRTCAHMAVVSEDGVTYIIVVRGLNMIEKDNVLELDRVAYNTVSSDQSRSSDKSTVSDFCVRSDDAR